MKPAGVRIGQLVPSSNTTVERVSRDFKSEELDVDFHYHRIGVRGFGANEENRAQFELEHFLRGIEPLMDVRPDAIVWNGTSGGLLGLDSDRRLRDEVVNRFSVPFTTTMLAIDELLTSIRATTCTAVMPYVDDVCKIYSDSLTGMGYTCKSYVGFDFDEVFDMGYIPVPDIAAKAAEVVRSDSDALLLLCTNLAGAYAEVALEKTLGLPVIDSTIASLWKAFDLCGLGTEFVAVNGLGRAYVATA